MEGLLYAVKLKDLLLPQQSYLLWHIAKVYFPDSVLKALLSGLQTDKFMHWVSVLRGGYREKRLRLPCARRSWSQPASAAGTSHRALLLSSITCLRRTKTRDRQWETAAWTPRWEKGRGRCSRCRGRLPCSPWKSPHWNRDLNHGLRRADIRAAFGLFGLGWGLFAWVWLFFFFLL